MGLPSSSSSTRTSWSGRGFRFFLCVREREGGVRGRGRVATSDFEKTPASIPEPRVLYLNPSVVDTGFRSKNHICQHFWVF